MNRCECDPYMGNCECFDKGVKAGLEQAAENAWRSTMSETQYRQITADRDYWKRKYLEAINDDSQP